MLDRTPLVILLALAASLSQPGTTDAAHRYRRHGGYGYPSFNVGYAPGYYPSIGVGYGFYPFSVGFSLHGGPKDPRGAVRFQVHPKQSEVYVDGYYAGIVDDFGKLRLDPGPHEITLYLEGYRVFTETVYSSTGSSVRLHHEMVPLEPGEPGPPRPAVPGRTTASLPPPSAPAAAPASASSTSITSEHGVLALRSQPSDAEVWIDGERWHFPGSSERMTVHLPTGRYELKLEKEGYGTFITMVDVHAGETTALNVRLGSATP